MALPRKSFKTEKGTELPLLNLKGKEYLQVMHRLVWFREKYPTGVIKTQMLEHNGAGKDEFFIFRAEIYIPIQDNSPQKDLVAVGHKKENVGSFPDAMEKAESGAIGRALAMMGIGTQFAADDLDEGDRLADSPAPVVEPSPNPTVGQITAAGRRPSFRRNVTTPTTSTAPAETDDI